MTHLPPVPRRLALPAGLLAAAILPALLPSRAEAFNCSASAIRGTLLGAQTVEPAVANAGAPDCSNQRSGISVPLPPVVTANVASAGTTTAGSGTTEVVNAAGGLGDIKVLSLSSLPIALPPVDLSPLAAVTIPGVGTVDLRKAAEALLPGGRLPNANLVELGAAVASANGRCVNGQPVLAGSSTVSGLKILGVDTPLNAVVERALTLVSSGSIDPSDIDPASIPLPAGVTLNPALTSAIKTVLDGLPAIAIPATLANVKVTPDQQERVGDRLTQRALRVEASILGRPIADVTIGEATVTSTGASCAPAQAAVAQSALQCTKRRLVLIDVLPGSRRVQLYGAADKRFVGRTVNIAFTATNRVVARARVRRDGTFRTTAAMPAKSIRTTNRARYEARIGRERSLELKLQRRMIVRSVRVSNGRVRITGRVSLPLARPVRSIEVRRRVSCARTAVVARIRPNSRGEFSVLVSAPPGQLAATYRFATRVRKTSRNPKTFPTFTLPRYVDLST